MQIPEDKTFFHVCKWRTFGEGRERAKFLM